MADDLRTLPPAEPRGPATTIELDSQPVRAYEGEPVAVALFAAGVRLLARSPKYHRPRGLFCATGHCASCLLRIDGQPNRRSCAVLARPGLRAERQNAFPDADVDLLRAADWLFPGGMDHHRLMTGSRLGNELFVKLVRQMGGTGTLPEGPASTLPPGERLSIDVLVVGGGPAGLAAAAEVRMRRSDLRVALLDDQDRPGGSWLAEPDGIERAIAAAKRATDTGVELRAGCQVLAHYAGDEADPFGVVIAAGAPALIEIRARRIIYATGAYDQNLALPDNDRPGTLAARAVGRLAFRWGVRPGRRVVIVHPPEGPPDYLARLAAGLDARGVEVQSAQAGRVPRVDLDTDVLAMGARPAPASELPRQHGARVRLDPEAGGFVVEADGTGACAPGVYVAGDVTGYVGPEAATIAGARTGRAVAESL